MVVLDLEVAANLVQHVAEDDAANQNREDHVQFLGKGDGHDIAVADLWILGGFEIKSKVYWKLILELNYWFMFQIIL